MPHDPVRRHVEGVPGLGLVAFVLHFRDDGRIDAHRQAVQRVHVPDVLAQAGHLVLVVGHLHVAVELDVLGQLVEMERVRPAFLLFGQAMYFFVEMEEFRIPVVFAPAG